MYRVKELNRLRNVVRGLEEEEEEIYEHAKHLLTEYAREDSSELSLFIESITYAYIN
jgi:hypothetical protein